MEVKINQVVLHLLDPGASEPVLSDRAMDMDADLYEYYTATLERAFASDEVKNCRFLPDSAFAAEMAQNQDFIDLSRRIAGVIFDACIHDISIKKYCPLSNSRFISEQSVRFRTRMPVPSVPSVSDHSCRKASAGCIRMAR